MKPEEINQSANRSATGKQSACGLLLVAILFLGVLSLSGCVVVGARVDPKSLSWGSISLGSSGIAQTVTLSNLGTSAISISGIAISGTNASDFAIASKTCGASLAGSSTCSVAVTFTPSADGAREATLTFNHSGYNTSQTVSLSGTGTGAISTLTVTPPSLSFGTVNVGTASPAQAVTLESNGTTAISIASVTIAGANSGDFSISANTCGSSLPGSGSCSIGITFNPAAGGSPTAILTISDSSSGSPQQVTLTGTGNVPVTGGVTVNPTLLTFASTSVGSTTAGQTVTLSNSGGTAATLGAASFSGANAGDFAIASNSCGASLAAAGTCAISVVFKPTAAGARAATLSISANGTALQVALSGTATASSTGVTVNPTALTFASTSVGSTTAGQTVTLSNSGGTAATLGTAGLSGADAGDFAIASNTCGASLAAGGSCAMSVIFKPTAAGTRAGTLSVSANGTALQVALSGTATASNTGSVSVSPTSVTFANTAIGSTSSPKSVTLSNTGASTITISSIAITGADASDFAITTKSCGSNLISGSSCSATMTFTPSASGTRTANLVFTDNAGNSPQTASLSGSVSVASTLSIAPTNPTVLVNATLQFTATANVTWTTTCGTITAAGLFTAPATAGSCTVTAKGSATSPPSVSTSVNVTAGSTSGTLTVYPSTAAVYVGMDQTFQAQLSLVPDANPVTFSVDGVTGGNATTGVITAQGLYTAPNVAGNHTLTVQDNTLGTAATAKISVFSGVSADYDSRSTSLHAVPAGFFGTERMDSLHDLADVELVEAGGMQYARIYAQIPFVFKTNSTPNWPAIDSIVQRINQTGQHVMLQIVQTPPWLQPSTNSCGAGNPAAMPTDVNAWAGLAVQYVKHMDATFPGLVTDYEIWNEPNTIALCVPAASRMSDYMQLYAATAPLMRAQAAADAAASGLPAARVGGPATAGMQSSWMSAMVSDPVISQNIDFLSYHDYLFSNHETGTQWDSYNGVVSVYQRTQDSGVGPLHSYAFATRLAAAGQQPQGKNLPIYSSEYNLDWAFLKNCCANDPTYSPVWNSMYAADMLNSVYDGAPNVPGHIVYFAATAVPYFCLIGQIDANMDCAYPSGSAPQLYPQYYAYQLLGAANYLNLEAGGYMAKSVSPATLGNGLVVTAFYTSGLDAVVLINPNQNTLTNVTVSLNNTGLTSAQGTLYTIVNGQSIQSTPITLQGQSGTSYTATVTIGPYSVQAISVHN